MFIKKHYKMNAITPHGSFQPLSLERAGDPNACKKAPEQKGKGSESSAHVEPPLTTGMKSLLGQQAS